MTLLRRSAATAVATIVPTVLIGSPAGAGAPPSEPVWPLHPRPAVVRAFEPPPQPWLAGHRGVDLAGSPGQLVRSATAGTIAYAGELAGRGVVVVARGPIRTTYEPVVASVRAGAPVRAGGPLGRLSAAGSHCSPRTCLHWGMRKGEEYVDPLSLFGRRPIRLLPLNGPGGSTGSTVRTERSVGPPTGSAGPAGTRTTRIPADEPPDRLGDAAEVPRKGGDTTGGLVVGLAAVVTVGGGLLIRRH